MFLLRQALDAAAAEGFELEFLLLLLLRVGGFFRRRRRRFRC
jgi:hypothetical protein